MNELMKIDSYKVQIDQQELEIIRENSGTTITKFDLDRVKVPSGGGQRGKCLLWGTEDMKALKVS